MSRKSVDEMFKEIREETPDFDALMVLADLGEKLADQIKKIREFRGLTQAQLAEQLGTKQSYVCRMEDPFYGKFNLQTLAKTAVVLNCDLTVSLQPKEANF